MTDSRTPEPVEVGLDDGYAYTKLALPDGRLVATLATWYDHVITDNSGEVTLADERLGAPIAVVDIGGRTTDYVVVADQAVVHDASGSLRCGLLDVKKHVEEGIRARYDLEVASERTVERAVQQEAVRLYGRDQDASALVREAKQLVVERLHAETRRQLGLGAELDRVLFVGGGSIALAESIRGWFPNRAVAEHPAFANARGMLKYLRYVCETPHGD